MVCLLDGSPVGMNKKFPDLPGEPYTRFADDQDISEEIQCASQVYRHRVSGT